MVVLRLANFYIASIRKTLRAVNVMTARNLASIQKGAGVHVLPTPLKIMLMWIYMYKKIQKKYKKIDKWMVM